MPLAVEAFDLPEHLSAKADPRLIADDERHFAALGASLEDGVRELSERLSAQLRAPGGMGQEAMDRDLEVHRLEARLWTLRRFGLDLCLGRMVPADGSAPRYVGRLGLTDASGHRLLLDWRSPAAQPFFAATRANPMGLSSRRRYRWQRGRIRDYWDEVFDEDGFRRPAALDDESAFIAGLGASRSGRMRDVLSTIQADQDAVIRAPAGGALVVEGGPGTGKTVVALHRAAFLLYAEPRLGHRRGGVLCVGPHDPYLAYVADVLPSLGEEGVAMCTLRDLVAEGAGPLAEESALAAGLKASTALVAAVDAAVSFYEEPPDTGVTVETDWATVTITPQEWAEAFGAAEPGTPHNHAREDVWAALVELVVEKVAGDEETSDAVRVAVQRNADLRRVLYRAWPLVDAADLVSDLWTVPAYLRRCAPSLRADEARGLYREDGRAWTVADLPLLDAARHRLGDPEASLRRQQRLLSERAAREVMASVVADLVQPGADEYGEGLVSMLRGEDFHDALVAHESDPVTDVDRLAGPFAHVVVDEAQELTDAQWHMLLRRCPSRSLTIVGDRAQARHGFSQSWEERLRQVGLDRLAIASLRVNYRTPEEVMAEAEPVIRRVLPDANVPTSVRRTGIPVRYGRFTELAAVLELWLAEHAEGVACVIAVAPSEQPGVVSHPRVRALTPELAKGLEFDLVVLLLSQALRGTAEGTVDTYVAMTRATQELVVLTDP